MSGFGGAGIVQRVGRDVVELRTGDRVAFVAQGGITTSIAVPAALCVKLPNSLSFEEAASIPQAVISALYAVERLARVRKDEVGQVSQSNG